MPESVGDGAKELRDATLATDLQDEYMNEQQFARFVDRDLRTIRRWDTQSIGPPRITIGWQRRAVILYRKSAVIAWLNAHEKTMPQPAKAGRRRARLNPKTRL